MGFLRRLDERAGALPPAGADRRAHLAWLGGARWRSGYVPQEVYRELVELHDRVERLEAEVRRHFPSLVFDTVIPRNVRLGEAPSFGRPVIHHDPHCAGADAYFELAKEVAARG